MKTVFINGMYYRVDKKIAEYMEASRAREQSLRQQASRSDSRRVLDLDIREKNMEKQEDTIEDIKWNWFLNGCMAFSDKGIPKEDIRERFEELGGILAE